MEYRAYGKEGIQLSIIGFGAIVLIGNSEEKSAALVSESVEAGMNYFDVAPTYGEAQGTPGIAEILLGPALKPYRKDMFLACKTAERTVDGASNDFYRSLNRLETDYFDLYQLHAITDVGKDVDAVFAKDGVMDFLIARKKEGRIRHLGFSAHSEAAALAAMERYAFDSVLFPLNYCAYMQNGFGADILKAAGTNGVSCLALKAMARQLWQPGDTRQTHSKCWYEPLEDPEQLRRAITWTLSHPITAALPPGEYVQFKQALKIVNNGLAPLSTDDIEALKQEAKKLQPIFGNQPV